MSDEDDFKPTLRQRARYEKPLVLYLGSRQAGKSAMNNKELNELLDELAEYTDKEQIKYLKDMSDERLNALRFNAEQAVQVAQASVIVFQNATKILEQFGEAMKALGEDKEFQRIMTILMAQEEEKE